MRFLILGCGNVGASLAVGLANSMPEVCITVADINLDLAKRVAHKISERIIAVQIDVFNREDLIQLIKKHDAVFNVCGPFYKTALPVINAAIEAGVDYIDINDDHDVAKEIFNNPDYDARAKRSGCIVLVGCGGTPGFTNVLAKHAADKLDKVQSIRLCWIVPYLPKYFSVSVIEHMFHMLSGTVTQYLGGKHLEVKPMEGVSCVEFLPPFGRYPAYYSGHAEPITLPRYVEGVEEVTIRSCFFPEEINDMIKSMVRLGLDSQEKLQRFDVSPVKFISEFIKSQENKASVFEEVNINPLGWATQIEVCGYRDMDFVRIIYEDHGFFPEQDQNDKEMDVGETIDPTGICARVTAEYLIKGKIKQTGVWALEGCVDTLPYISEVIAATGKKIYFKEEILKDCVV